MSLETRLLLEASFSITNRSLKLLLFIFVFLFEQQKKQTESQFANLFEVAGRTINDEKNMAFVHDKPNECCVNKFIVFIRKDIAKRMNYSKTRAPLF